MVVREIKTAAGIGSISGGFLKPHPMKHHLMNKFGPILGILLLCVIVAGSAFLPSSCLSPQAQARFERVLPVVVPLTQAAITWADRTGNLPPGSSVTINQGLAVISSNGAASEKIVQLKTLGIESEVKRGVLKEGDIALVDAAGTALVKLVEAAETPALQEASAKEPVPQLLPPPGS